MVCSMQTCTDSLDSPHPQMRFPRSEYLTVNQPWHKHKNVHFHRNAGCAVKVQMLVGAASCNCPKVHFFIGNISTTIKATLTRIQQCIISPKKSDFTHQRVSGCEWWVLLTQLSKNSSSCAIQASETFKFKTSRYCWHHVHYICEYNCTFSPQKLDVKRVIHF